MKNMVERLLKARAARHENREAGFSLIELIVVVAILGILVAVAIPVYGNIQDRAANNAAATACGSAVAEAAANYADQEGAVVTAEEAATAASTRHTRNKITVVVTAGTPDGTFTGTGTHDRTGAAQTC